MPGVRQGVARIALMRGALLGSVIGCRHDEGVDYDGRACPRFPLWAGRDRFTHEIVHCACTTYRPLDTIHHKM